MNHNVYLTKEQKSDLVQYCTYMADRGWPLVSDETGWGNEQQFMRRVILREVS